MTSLRFAFVFVGLVGCAPPEPLAPVSPRPAATGALVGRNVKVHMFGPGHLPAPETQAAIERAFRDAGLEVVSGTEPTELSVNVEQPLSEWTAANHCYVQTLTKQGKVSDLDPQRNCDQPNVPDHIVAAWLADPKVLAAAAALPQKP